MALSILVVFATAYALIMPAATLDTKEAQKQGGIDVTEPVELDGQESGGQDTAGQAHDGEDIADEESSEDVEQGSGEEVEQDTDDSPAADPDAKAGLPLGKNLKALAISGEAPLWAQHAVNHLDLSIKSGSEAVDVPLAYGKYYDENHQVVLEVEQFQKIHLGEAQVVDPAQLILTKEDAEGASITAHKKNGETAEDAFSIDGYSASAGKVRVNGAFKVAEPGSEYDPIEAVRYTTDKAYKEAVDEARLASPIRYSVSLMKPVTYYMQIQDPEDDSRMIQLYDADGTALTITADVAFSASFDYWDEHNKCQELNAEEKYDAWQAGEVATSDTSGMDIELGAAASSQSKVYAIEITKLVVDENGNRIKTEEGGSNKFYVYRNPSTNGSLVQDLDIGSFTETPDYSDYALQHDKTLAVGSDGLGMVYDYDVDPGLYYIKEDPESIKDEITDTTGKTWSYKSTHILTEYAWRNHQNDNYMHVSDTFGKKQDYEDSDYSSVPEILGDHQGYSDGNTYTNDFLEFYVYNVYESPKVDVPVLKTWTDFEGAEYDWAATFKLQWAPLYEGETSPSASFHDVSPVKEMTIFKADMEGLSQELIDRYLAGDDTLTDAQRAKIEKVTFKNLPKYGTDSKGNTFRYQYSLEEVSYQVMDAATSGVIYSWDDRHGYNEPDEDTHYVAFYPHDAGECDSDEPEQDADNANYYINVTNTKRNISQRETIDVSLDKQWDNTFEAKDNSYWAEFELRRFVHTEYRDTSHMSASDRAADPVTITIKNGDTVVDTLQVQPNVGLYLGGNFKPHDSARSVTFTADHPVRLANDSRISTITATAEGSNMSNAIARSQEFFVTQDTVFTITDGAENLVESKMARVLDTGSGSSPVYDRTFSQTIRLDYTNDWHIDLQNLVRSETSAGDDDDNENITYYEYYFVEKDSNPKGYAQYYHADSSGNPTDVLSGDADHQIEHDEAVVAVNGPSNRLIVKKDWRGITDYTGFPGVTFTLYWVWEDDQNANNPNVYVDSSGTRYENIEIKGNSLEWICPEVLPQTMMDTSQSGNPARRVKYFIREDEESRSGSVMEGDITTSWEFYYYRNGKGSQTREQHRAVDTSYTGAELAQNGGTITICNTMKNYIQMDIQKQFFELGPAGSWGNTTANRARSAVLGFKVIRAIKTADGKWLDERGQAFDKPVWMDYSSEMLCGYDENGQKVVKKDENDPFWLHAVGNTWEFRIENNEGDRSDATQGGIGLPSYGFYVRNGEDIPVEYWYSYREINVYKDINKTPYPEWDWYSSITPINAYGPGQKTMEAFPDAVTGDAMRVANYQASDLIIDKEWVGDPTAKEVYVKVWRTTEGGEPEDFTAIIAEDVRSNNNWQMYMTDPAEVDLQRECLILKPDSTGKWEDQLKVNRSLLGALSGAGEYHYYIQEIGYRTEKGEYRSNANSKYKPKYDKWVDDHWTGAPVGTNNYADNNIKIGAKGENRLKVINQSVPSTSYTVTKAFYGPQSSTGGQSSVTGKYPTDGSGQVVVELQQRYRYEKTEDGVDYVSADNENWVRADSKEAKTTWTVDWQGAESADPTSVVLPLKKPAGSTLSDEAWYGSAAAWSYTWEGLDLQKVIAEEADPQNTKKAQLYYRAVEVSTPVWFNSVIAEDEKDGHKAIDDDDQTAAQRQSERNAVTNEREDCTLKLDKKWTSLGGTELAWPQGYVVSYQLIQNFHLVNADMTHTSTGDDGKQHIDPEYSYGKTFKRVDMKTSYADGMTADQIHPQAVSTIENTDGMTLTGLPVYGFLTATAADVTEAAKAGVTLKEGVVYPVVYTYSAKETSVKKNGEEVGFRPQTVDASLDETAQGGKTYKAEFTNKLGNITVRKDWNGLTPGTSESATIKLLRFEKEPEATTFMYTVTVTGSAEALTGNGTVTAVIYNSTGEEAGRYELKKNDWSHDFELPVGETYHAVFLGDGEVLESAVTPSTAENISDTGSAEIQAIVKPVASGSVKVIVTGSPHELWMNPLEQVIGESAQEGTQQSWNPNYFDGAGGETGILEGLIRGAEYRFQIGDIPDSVENADINGNSIEFTATNGLTTITLNYSSGGEGSNTTSGSFTGGTNYWGINDWSKLTVGQTYSFTFQTDYNPTECTVDAAGVSNYSYEITNNWTSGGQIKVTFVPESADEPVVITASHATGNRALRSAAPKSAKAAPLRAPASVTWTNNPAGLPTGADPSKDETVDTVTFPGSNNTWLKTWENLDTYSPDGKEYVYYAYETDWAGAAGATALETTYSVAEDGTLVVTNTPVFPDLGNLKVNKEVFYGDARNTQAAGMSFKVGIFIDEEGNQRAKDADDVTIGDQTITVSGGKGDVTFTGLTAGTYYVYEIDADGDPVTKTGAAATVVAGGNEYTVTYTGNPATVANGQTAEMSIRNTKAPFDLNIIKTEKDKPAVALNGAEFALNKLVESGTDESRTISYDPAFAERTAVTATVSGNAGRASFDDLPLGYYEIKETKAPAGYILNGDTIFWIKVTSTGIERVVRDNSKPMDEWETAGSVADDPVTFTASGETFTATIANTPGAELPSSGGPGTTWIYLLGVILLLGCGTSLIARRRAKAGR